MPNTVAITAEEAKASNLVPTVQTAKETLASAKQEKWGYTTYRRLGWVQESGAKFYEVYLVDDNYTRPGASWAQLTVRIWAKHPRKAAEAICSVPRTAQEVLDFVKTYTD